MFEFRPDQQGPCIMFLSFQENKLTCAKESKLKITTQNYGLVYCPGGEGTPKSIQGRGFTKGPAPGNVTGCKDDFDCLV